MNSPKFILLVGVPCSGKTTFCLNLQKEDDYVVISKDDILIEMFPDKTYNEAFIIRSENKNVRDKILHISNTILKEAIKNKKNIIIDDTNLKQSHYIEKLKLLSSDYYRKAIVLKPKLQLIMERNEIRMITENKYIPTIVLTEMYKILEIPLLSNFNEVSVI